VPCDKSPAGAEVGRGDVVVSLSGDDQGRLQLVVDETGDRLLLADGKRRPYGAPKKKNRRHVALVCRAPFEAPPPTDRALRRALRALREGDLETQKAAASGQSPLDQGQKDLPSQSLPYQSN